MRHPQKLITIILAATSSIATALVPLTALVAPALQIVPIAHAQSGSYSGTGQEIVCRNASRDWVTFLSAVISYDDFAEYWKDIFVRYNANACLYNDIAALLKRIEKVRSQIRSAFFACDGQAEKLKNTYYRLEAELFFLRKYVAVGNGQFLVPNDASNKKVYIELRNYFALNRGFFTEAEVKKLFDEFVTRYKTRLEIYQNCSDPSWENLVAKWNELKDLVKGGFGVKEAAESIKHKFDKALNTPFMRTGNLLGGLLDARINDVSPLDALSDINQELQKNLPGGFTFDQLNAAQMQAKNRYQDDFNRATYLAQYEQLYKETSDDAIRGLVARLKSLEDSIKNTFKFINQTYQCTKGILDRAC